MKREGLVLLVLVALLAVSGIATARGGAFNASRTFEFDPDHTRCPSAAWRPNVGQKDSFCRTAFGLVLSKDCALETNASAGAVLENIKGETIDECGPVFGYDIKNGSPCGAGAPRFNVNYTTPSGASLFSFVGGCSNGTLTDLGNGWSRVTFDTCSAAQSFPPIPVGSTITSAVLIVDEPGTYTLDNIQFNGLYADKPGTAGALPQCP